MATVEADCIWKCWHYSVVSPTAVEKFIYYASRSRGDKVESQDFLMIDKHLVNTAL